MGPQQRILQPAHKRIVDQIHSIGIVGQAVPDLYARSCEPQEDREKSEGGRGARHHEREISEHLPQAHRTMSGQGYHHDDDGDDKEQ